MPASTTFSCPTTSLAAPSCDRLKALHGRVTLSVTADSDETLEGHAATFTDAGHPLSVLVECDTGVGRCGVQSRTEALALAKVIGQAKGLPSVAL